MATVVNMHQAKASLSRLVERVLAGEEVVIARNGQPLVQLVPAPKTRQPRDPGQAKSKTGIPPDAELADEEVTGLSEAPMSPDT
ncbi:MAG TPA: type II toxin-antitoxin system prevent-host-death family antitoxin [Stellaceae bacterium]|jgi:prevent-host-death family protein|nr:type II toxin-antitoxin system prevent-host-death family antitoxin [Stellaceae bacterium]